MTPHAHSIPRNGAGPPLLQDILIATPELPIYNPSLASSSAAYWLRCLIDLRMQDLLPLVSGFLGDTIAADAPLMEAGLDPIGAAHAEVRNAVASKFGVEVPATITFDYSSVDRSHKRVARMQRSCKEASSP